MFVKNKLLIKDKLFIDIFISLYFTLILICLLLPSFNFNLLQIIIISYKYKIKYLFILTIVFNHYLIYHRYN